MVEVDLDNVVAIANGRTVSLTPLEFDLLTYLLRHAGRVVPHQELFRQVVGVIPQPQSSLLRVHVTHLRRKLGELGEVIETVRGRGFCVLRDNASRFPSSCDPRDGGLTEP